MAYVRTVKTALGATAVQIVWSSRRGSRSIEHLGSAHDAAQLEALKAAAATRLAQGQQTLDLGIDTAAAPGGPLQIVSSRAAHLWEALCHGYRELGFHQVLAGDEVLRDLVCARIIEPTSKADSVRVLAETGVGSASYRTIKRRLPEIAEPVVRQSFSSACARHAQLGPATLVLYDVTTLLCRRRHNSVYAEFSVMPMFRVDAQVSGAAAG